MSAVNGYYLIDSLNSRQVLLLAGRESLTLLAVSNGIDDAVVVVVVMLIPVCWTVN